MANISASKEIVNENSRCYYYIAARIGLHFSLAANPEYISEALGTN